MYVVSEYRNKGVGKKLLQAVFERVKEIKDIELIKLSLISSNNSAKRLYKKFGFKTYGIEVDAIKWKGRYFG